VLESKSNYFTLRKGGGERGLSEEEFVFFFSRRFLVSF